jgi:hypothetical protein
MVDTHWDRRELAFRVSCSLGEERLERVGEPIGRDQEATTRPSGAITTNQGVPPER